MKAPAYLSAEDSALLRKAIRSHSGGSFLEIGTGNGGTMVEASARHGLVVGSDISKPDMDDWRQAGSNFVLADKASCFRASVFDLVAFNPPYLPVEAAGDPAVGGGVGLEVPKGFLKDSLRVVKRSGEVVFLLNDEGGLDEFAMLCADEGFTLRRTASQRVFFEELAVYSAKARASERAALRR